MTKAARRLGVTQPAVSQQVRLLAADLGCVLYRRRGSRFELTPEGEFAYATAKSVLSELADLPGELGALRKKVVGKVRIGSGQVAAKTVLGDVIQQMSRECPEVSFALVETNSSDIPELILRSRIDLGIGILPEIGRGLRLQQLLTGRLVLLCAVDHPFSARQTVSRRDLAKLDLIRHSRENAARRIAYELYGEAGAAGSFHLEAMNTETIMAYVRRNMGMALASSYTVDWLRPAGIAAVELEERTEIPWGVMSDASRPLSRAACVFVDTLVAHFAAVAPQR